jgi:hypothetical protein
LPDRWARAAIQAALAGALAVTAARSVRLPNDFAEAHWLIDYRFGVVKRGLVGEMLARVTGLGGVEITATLIAVLGCGALAAFLVALYAMAVRIVDRSGWSVAAVLAVLAFLSSPFVVITAHLTGYFDHLILPFTIGSIALLQRGKPLPAGLLAAVSIFVHEAALLVGWPLLVGAWLVERRSGRLRAGWRSAWPMLLPAVAFLVLAVNELRLNPQVQDALTAHLARYPFVEHGVHASVPSWMFTTFAEHFRVQAGYLPSRLALPQIHGIVLPTLLALLTFLIDGQRIRLLSVEAATIVGTCLATQVLQLAAWDTARIATYAILAAFVVVWVYVRPAERQITASPAVCLVAAAAIASNILVSPPLMDQVSDRLPAVARIFLYLPMLAVAVTAVTRTARLTSPDPAG